MSNNEIVTEVYKSYQVSKLISKMIKESNNDGSGDDLEQYIYVTLLEMDNRKLNCLFKENKLRNYIALIIKNQRDCKKYSIYRKKYQITEKIDVNENTPETIEILDNRVEYVYMELDRMENLWHCTGLTEETKELIISFSIYKYYVVSGISQRELFKRIWWIPKMEIQQMIRDTKNKLYNGYVEFSGDYDIM